MAVVHDLTRRDAALLENMSMDTHVDRAGEARVRNARRGQGPSFGTSFTTSHYNVDANLIKVSIGLEPKGDLVNIFAASLEKS